jgi:hypothetical protein
MTEMLRMPAERSHAAELAALAAGDTGKRPAAGYSHRSSW